MNDWLVFNTSKGKDLQGPVKAGASFSTSIRGLGQYNKDTREIENYDFLGCDAVGNPSAGTFASKEQFKVTVESVKPRQAARIQEQLEDTMPKQYDISEKIGAFREKHLKDGVPSKITREMTTDLLTMRRECVEAGHDTQELDALSNEIFGEQTEPRAPPSPKLPAQNSNQDRDLLNRAQRELEATQNLAVHLKNQVTELETSISTTERQLSRYRRVAESLQEQIDAVMREADETQSFQAARLVRKAVSAVNEVPATLDELGISKKQRIAAVLEDEIEAVLIGTAGLRKENHMHDRARMRCRAQPHRAHRRSATGIYDASPSAVAWLGRKPPATTGVLWSRPTFRAGNE